jgi:REP element-mobilizing transposase RayT
MVRTHVHLLVRVRPTTDVSRLLQRFKGGSAAVAGKERHSTDRHVLRWAKGYSIHSVSPRDIAAVRAYVRDQRTHHPELAIPGWNGDQGEYETVGNDEWRSEVRRRI